MCLEYTLFAVQRLAMHGPEPPAHTIYDVSASTHFGHPPSAPPGYSFMLRPTKTVRPGAGENIGRALSQKKLSYHA